ncbi:ribosomal protein S18-alanine N-acetyltransferase [Paraglaciecola sp. 2405UD69-4]|uniref:ribosomal protein S18-alanine N-acetyltransferase n=1 Tax=Paraglaciecola sp. 2405UD69-4 TaxID=3391836 RepID=UPI0039C9D023
MDLEFSAVTSDLNQTCFDLHVQGQFSPWSKRIFDDCITPPYFANCLLIDEQVMGYYIAMPVLDEVTLMDIVVDRKFQGKGYGKRLLEHFIKACSSKNAVQLWLEVRESNKAAIYLYEQQGFVLIEQRKNYYPTASGKEDALIMGLYIG